MAFIFNSFPLRLELFSGHTLFSCPNKAKSAPSLGGQKAEAAAGKACSARAGSEADLAADILRIPHKRRTRLQS